MEPGAQVARLVLAPEISLYVHLKHLGVRNNGIGSVYLNAQRELVNFRFICVTRQGTTRKRFGPSKQIFKAAAGVTEIFIEKVFPKVPKRSTKIAIGLSKNG